MGTFLKSPTTRSRPLPTSSPTGAPVVLHLGDAHAGTRAVRTWCRSRAATLATRGIRTHAEGFTRNVDGGAGDQHPGLGTWLRSIHAPTHGTRSHGAFYTGPGGTGPVLDLANPGVYPHLAQALRRVTTIGAGLDLHVQFVIADHAAFCEAVYVRQVARGLALTFDEFLDVAGREPSWVPLVRTLVEAFGADRVIVYESGAGRPAVDRVLGDAMTRLGVAHLATRAPRRRTMSGRSGRAADLRLSMGPRLRTESERMAFRQFLRSGLFVADRPAMFVTPEHAAKLSARYAEDLLQLRELVQVR